MASLSSLSPEDLRRFMLIQAIRRMEEAQANPPQQSQQPKADPVKAGKGILSTLRDAGILGGSSAAGGAAAGTAVGGAGVATALGASAPVTSMGALAGNGLFTPAAAAGYTPVASSIGGGTIASASPAAAGAAPSGLMASAMPYAGPVAGALAAWGAFNKGSKATKTETGFDAVKSAYGQVLKDPLGNPLQTAAALLPASYIAGALFGDKDMYLTENRRLGKLAKAGVNVPQSAVDQSALSKGQSREQLIANAQKQKDAGKWGNVEFAKSRNESDLKAEDIWGSAAMYERFGNDWLGKLKEAQRRQIADRAIANKAVNEHHGTIDIDFENAQLKKEIEQILGNGKGPAPANPISAVSAASGMQIPRTGKRAPNYVAGPRR